MDRLYTDDPLFQNDYFNLLNMFRHDPGVEHVHLYVAVSLVQNFNSFQKQILDAILQEAANCRWLTLVSVILKPNRGRDFSSLYQCLSAMKAHLSDDDFILVRNRSSSGPSASHWYKKYADLLVSDTRIGMVGSTINLNDHYSRGRKQNASHVQSYVFLTKWKYLSPLMDEFPALNVVTHVDAVLHGEIELSQKIMRSGAMIASLQKPKMLLDIHNQNDPVQSTYKPHLAFSNMPIIHQKRVRRNFNFWLRKLGYLNVLGLLIKKKKPIMYVDKTK
jgi:hypothetical protein